MASSGSTKLRDLFIEGDQYDRHVSIARKRQGIDYRLVAERGAAHVSSPEACPSAGGYAYIEIDR